MTKIDTKTYSTRQVHALTLSVTLFLSGVLTGLGVSGGPYETPANVTQRPMVLRSIRSPKLRTVATRKQMKLSMQKRLQKRLQAIVKDDALQTVKRISPVLVSKQAPITAIPSKITIETTRKEPMHAAAPVPTLVAQTDFPALGTPMNPFGKVVPNWGWLQGKEKYDREYSEFDSSELVTMPRFDLEEQQIPFDTLTSNPTEENRKHITAKLFYSTELCGAYDIDKVLGSGRHGGIDLKVGKGTPIRAIAGGKVVAVNDTKALGPHVIIEHRPGDGNSYYSIYGHMDSISVSVGDALKSGQTIGTVGTEGNSTGPHLHLQLQINKPEVFLPSSTEECMGALGTTLMNPLSFIAKFQN